MPPNANRLYKVQYFLDYFSKKFEENFFPRQNISIDEGMIPWRRRLNFKVYNPSKITKYDLLVRMVCASVTGYILGFKLYSGTGQKIEKTVMDLLKNYFNKWHHVYMDNLYNSVNLVKILVLYKIRLCGIIRVHRGLPEFFNKAKLKVMETIFARQGNILLQLYKTNKKRDIGMISTIHIMQIFLIPGKRIKMVMQSLNQNAL
ncbi:piggyBac transposable element-derived protein 4-like [Vespa mandarinia]|uniref:piggyBac transposable element-derived protein 4-like n=1 Tax=Vespa mandarinia TaxID=7446 RepID=UPI001608AC1F|nr:piggyBac transposable element-derived protein 4-like [Vespa mandarinia]